MKLCCVCKLLKDNFCKNKNNKGGLSVQCKDCAKQYRELTKDKIYKSGSKEYRKEYFNNNKDHINSLRRARNLKNNSKNKLRSLIYYYSNVDVLRLKQKIYYQNNKEYFSVKSFKFRQLNKESINFRNRARRLKITENKIKQLDIDWLIENHNNKCGYCGINIVKGINLHIDHIVPLCKNGKHSIENLIPSCKECNLRKGTKTKEEFLAVLEKTNVC